MLKRRRESAGFPAANGLSMNDTGEPPARRLESRRGAPDGVSVVLPAFNAGAAVVATIAALRQELASPVRAMP